MPKRFCPKHLLLIVLCLSSVSYAQEISRLELNQSFEREIKGGETHSFSLMIGANQTARVEIEQKGIDVSIAAVNPKGEKYIETESPSGLLGGDLILVTATDAGEYRIEISPADPRAVSGKYIVKLTEIRATVQKDIEINKAAAQITKLANETTSLRQSGTREGRRAALEKFREIVELSRVKQDKVWEVVALVSSGLVCEQMSEIQNALNFYLQGLSLAREIGNRQYEGSALNNLAVNYNMLGDYETATNYLNQAIALQRETGNKRGEAVNLNNFGTTYLLLGDLTKAEDFYRKGLAIRREIKDQRGEGFALNNLGQVFLQNGDLPKALDFLGQALTLRRAIDDRAGEATTLRNLGKTFWASNDKAKAVENFEQANALAKQLGDRRVEADSFYWLASAEKERGNLPKAIENIENGLQIIEQIRGELVNPELRAGYFSTVQDFYELYTDLLVARFEKSKIPYDAELALQISERARTRSLIELLQEARVNIKQGVDEKLLEREADLLDALNAKYRQRTQLLSGKPTPEQVSKITNEITSLDTELDDLQTKIRVENPRYAGLKQTETLSARGIQDLLDEKTVLLEYKLGATRSFLWLVTKNSIEIFILPSRNEIESKAKEFYAAAARDRSNETKAVDLSKALSAILLAPVNDKILNKRTLIVADGILQYVPFAALWMRGLGLPEPQFLGRINELIMLPSANVLAEIRRNNAAGKTPQKTLAIFADAVFEANDTLISKVDKKTGTVQKNAEISKISRDFDSEKGFPRLLFSRAEARSISSFVLKDDVELNIDFSANRENVTGKNLEKFKILHFATHGLLDTSRPEFSGLVLSLYDKNGKSQDGFLRLNQIYNLNLNSDLVVLSACQTALGKDVRGEGLIGLTRGFMYAGARRVVASLWKVDDAATAEFMKRFYQNLFQRKLAPAAALRQAQYEMFSLTRFRAPYYWAGFTLQGEWK